MKKVKLAILICLAFLLTGCIQKYELTDKQEDATAEYMAGLLLENDSDYEGGLTSVSSKKTYEQLLEGEETPTLAEKSQNDNSTEDDSDKNNSSTDTTTIDTQASVSGTEKDTADEKIVSNDTLNNVIGKKNFVISYKKYHLYDNFPEDSSNTTFSLSSRKGNKLLVIAFSVKNLTDSKKKIDMSNSKITYMLDNKGKKLKPLLTFLVNDLQYLDVDIEAEKSKGALLVFEVSKKDDISKDKLIISKGSKTNIVDLK